MRLNDLEHEFKGSLLVRVHASFIINLEKIRSVRKDTITMESGKEIPVTRKYKDQFNRAFQIIARKCEDESGNDMIIPIIEVIQTYLFVSCF